MADALNDNFDVVDFTFVTCGGRRLHVLYWIWLVERALKTSALQYSGTRRNSPATRILLSRLYEQKINPRPTSSHRLWRFIHACSTTFPHPLLLTLCNLTILARPSFTPFRLSLRPPFLLEVKTCRAQQVLEKKSQFSETTFGNADGLPTTNWNPGNPRSLPTRNQRRRIT